MERASGLTWTQDVLHNLTLSDQPSSPWSQGSCAHNFNRNSTEDLQVWANVVNWSMTNKGLRSHVLFHWIHNKVPITIKLLAFKISNSLSSNMLIPTYVQLQYLTFQAAWFSILYFKVCCIYFCFPVFLFAVMQQQTHFTNKQRERTNMIWTRKWNGAGKNDLQSTGTKFYQLEE